MKKYILLFLFNIFSFSFVLPSGPNSPIASEFMYYQDEKLTNGLEYTFNESRTFFNLMFDSKLVFYTNREKANTTSYILGDVAVFYNPTEEFSVIYYNTNGDFFEGKRDINYKENDILFVDRLDKNLKMAIFDNKTGKYVNYKKLFQIEDINDYTPSLLITDIDGAYSFERVANLTPGDKNICLEFKKSNGNLPLKIEIYLNEEMVYSLDRDTYMPMDQTKLKDIKGFYQNGCIDVMNVDLGKNETLNYVIYIHKNEEIEIYNIPVRGIR